VPFLSEHELPDKARRLGEAEVAEEMGSSAAQGVRAGVADPNEKNKGRAFPGSGAALGGGGSSAGPGSSSSSTGIGAMPSMGGNGGGASQMAEADIQTVRLHFFLHEAV
jgi:DNA damage-inducible protein 1